MKARWNISPCIIAMALVSALTANVKASVNGELIKQQPHAVYHVIKDKTLLETAKLIATRSGMIFEIAAELENDLVTQKLAADNWQEALSQLLQGYNYTTTSNNHTIQKVLITGRHGNAPETPKLTINTADRVIVEPNLIDKLPPKYKNFAQGSVLNVTLPLDQLREIAVGDRLTFELPIGQFQVNHDNFIEHEDGSATWIGYLNDEGQGYRIYLSQGESGVIGNIYTPDGAYNIETVDGKTYLVDLEKSGLQSAGFEHDEAEAPDSAMLLLENGLKMGNAINNLQTAAKKARTTANALATEAQKLYSTYLQSIKTAQNTLANANKLAATVAETKAKLAEAQAALKKSPNNHLKATVNQLSAAYKNQNRQWISAIRTYNAAVKTMQVAKKNYDKKQAQANAAEANAKKAEAALTAKQTASATVSGTAAQTNTIVDLMVLYTTVNQTASYAKQRIQYLVDLSNQAYKDSGINMRLRLVHTRQTSYVENNANSQALYDLATDKGAFAGTAALRNQYGADLVVLFRPLYAQTAGSCGTTYVGFANGSNANASLGFGTIGDGYSKDTLPNYYCGNHTFTHEIGHNLGNVHDREYSSFAGKFDYSYAWGINGQFGTIMSYYGPSVMLFSSPSLPTQCAGTPCGYAEGTANASDQTRTINYTAPMVATYKPTTVAVPVIQ